MELNDHQKCASLISQIAYLKQLQKRVDVERLEAGVDVECGHDEQVERNQTRQRKEEVEVEPPKCTETRKSNWLGD